MIENLARIFKVKRFSWIELNFKSFRETLRQKHPNTICIKLKWLSDSSIQKSFTVLNNVTASKGNHSCRFHGVPPRSLSHNVPIITVKNNFMRQLHGFIKSHQYFSLFCLDLVFLIFVLFSKRFLYFAFCLEFVSSISKGSDSINIKWILSHTDSISSDLTRRNMDFRIYFLTVLPNLSFKFFLELPISHGSISFLHCLLFENLVLSLVQRKMLPFPLPLHLSFTVILRFIVVTIGTYYVIYYSNRLQSIS